MTTWCAVAACTRRGCRTSDFDSFDHHVSRRRPSEETALLLAVSDMEQTIEAARMLVEVPPLVPAPRGFRRFRVLETAIAVTYARPFEPTSACRLNAELPGRDHAASSDR
jgi:hypothetical protein